MSDSDFALELTDIPGSYRFRDDSIVTYTLDPFKDRTIKGCLYTAMLALPGFLKWGDISLARALCSNKNITITGLRGSDGTPFTAQEISDFYSEIKILIDKLK